MEHQARIKQMNEALDKAAQLYPTKLEGNKHVLIQSIRDILLCMPGYSTSLYLGSGYHFTEMGNDHIRANSKVTSVSEDFINLEENVNSYNVHLGDLAPIQLYQLLQHIAGVVKYHIDPM